MFIFNFNTYHLKVQPFRTLPFNNNRMRLFKPAKEQAHNIVSNKNIIRINADNSSKKTLTFFWAFFIIFEIIVFITSNFTPESLVYKTNQSQLANTQHNDCKNPTQFNMDMLSCKDFNQRNPKLGLIMRNLSPLHQFAQISLLYIPKNKVSQTLTIKQQFSFQLISLTRKIVEGADKQKYAMYSKGETIRRIQNFTFDSTQQTLQTIDFYNGDTRNGYDIKLGFYRQFVTEDALFLITFLDLDKQLASNYDIVPIGMLMNPQYTKFIIIFRLVFFAITAMAFFFYLKQSVSLSKTLQRKIIVYLSVTVLLFNDPYYIVQVFKPNTFSIFLSTVFIAAFIITLVMSWIFILQKISCQNQGREFAISSRKKIGYTAVAAVYFIIIFTFNFEVGYYAFTQSPIIPFHSIFIKIYLALAFLFGLIFLYIGWLYYSIVKNWGDLIWRYKIYVTFNIFFIILNLIFISLGWLSFYDESSQKFEIFYASMNFYVIYLQYMYSEASQTSATQSLPLTQNSNRDIQTETNNNQACITIDLDQQQNHQFQLQLEK